MFIFWLIAFVFGVFLFIFPRGNPPTWYGTFGPTIRLGRMWMRTFLSLSLISFGMTGMLTTTLLSDWIATLSLGLTIVVYTVLAFVLSVIITSAFIYLSPKIVRRK